MTLNPLSFANEVNKQYLRYQLTSARLADPVLAKQFTDKLWRRHSPLFKGPYVSLSKPFMEGSRVEDLIQEGVLHPRIGHIIPCRRLGRCNPEAITRRES